LTYYRQCIVGTYIYGLYPCQILHVSLSNRH
jgi:hypothetical protein